MTKLIRWIVPIRLQRTLPISQRLVYRQMSEFTYKPPEKVEQLYAATDGNKWASINAPTAGAREDRDLPVGEASFQYYSLATPNGQKPAILLEELGIDYDAHKIKIDGEQFTSGFVAINPNSKIPAAVDKDGPGGKPVRLFESASIMLYLAEKYNRFLPSDPSLKPELINWLFWQVGGQGPITGACFGHFYAYAPDNAHAARDYCLGRYGMEVKRLMSVLENHLTGRIFMVGDEYTIADMALFPWAHQLRNGYKNPGSQISASSFLSVEESYPNVMAWCDRIAERPAVQRGLTVCQWLSDKPKPWL